jgi:hypothetical protein
LNLRIFYYDKIFLLHHIISKNETHHEAFKIFGFIPKENPIELNKNHQQLSISIETTNRLKDSSRRRAGPG